MKAHRIGIIGGLSTNAGLFYYKEIERRVVATGDSPDLLLIHADVQLVLSMVSSGRVEDLAKYLKRFVCDLQKAGCRRVAIAAIAPHICIDRLKTMTDVPIVDIVSLVRQYASTVLSHGRVAVFGNRAVMETNVFNAISDRQILRPPPDVVASVHTIYNDIAVHGKRGSEPEYTALETHARVLIQGGADAIVLAGTDLSSFYRDRLPSFPYVDIAQLHIEAIASTS